MSDTVINVLMTGGRRCGKTSVLAAMQGCLQKITAETGVSIQPANKYLVKILEDKRKESRAIFKDQDKFKSGFVPEDNPSEGIVHYKFKLLVDNKDTGINVVFHDFPGEWLINHNEINKDDIKKLISNSDILLFAIDTPHLMEEDGEFDDVKNLQMRLNEFIKNSFFHGKHSRPFYVLFVPLKCEKYRNLGKMDEVAECVIKSYDDIIKNIKKNAAANKLAFQMAITPIFTLGGVRFKDFARDEDGEVILTLTSNKAKIPKEPTYVFTKAGYKPMFCEQPLLYILKFALDTGLSQAKKESEELKKEGGVFPKVIAGGVMYGIGALITGGSILPLIAMGAAYGMSRGLKNRSDINSQEEKIKRISNAINKFIANIKTRGDGYKIIP